MTNREHEASSALIYRWVVGTGICRTSPAQGKGWPLRSEYDQLTFQNSGRLAATGREDRAEGCISTDACPIV